MNCPYQQLEWRQQTKPVSVFKQLNEKCFKKTLKDFNNCDPVLSYFPGSQKVHARLNVLSSYGSEQIGNCIQMSGCNTFDVCGFDARVEGKETRRGHM